MKIFTSHLNDTHIQYIQIHTQNTIQPVNSETKQKKQESNKNDKTLENIK